jgi:hypothetical protein
LYRKRENRNAEKRVGKLILKTYFMKKLITLTVASFLIIAGTVAFQAKATQLGPSHSNLRSFSTLTSHAVSGHLLTGEDRTDLSYMIGNYERENLALNYTVRDASNNIVAEEIFIRATIDELRNLQTGNYIFRIGAGNDSTTEPLVK